MADALAKKPTSGRWQNWSGGVVAQTRRIAYPSSEDELALILREASGPVRVTGTGHSFTALCATDGTLLSLDQMSGVVSVDKAGGRATVRAGSKIHALGKPLFDDGVGFKNQGDIDRQAIAGAVSTGTHGTGVDLQSFSAEVTGLRLVTPSGEVISASRDQNADVFEAGRLSLGTLGVLSEITLQVRDAYKLKGVDTVVPIDQLLRDLPALKNKHRHIEFFWFPYTDVAVLKTLDETNEDAPAPRSSAAMAARGEVETADQRAFKLGSQLVRLLPALAPYAQRIFTRGMAGSTKVRWSHEAFPSPRTTRFNEMEYAVPAAKGIDCIREVVAELRAKKISTAFPFEFRLIKGDDVWLSPFYQRDSATIAVHQYCTHGYRPLFDAAERIFRRYDGRPHWGKLHSRGARELEVLYPRFDDFRKVRARLDPQGKMLNPYLKQLFGV